MIFLTKGIPEFNHKEIIEKCNSSNVLNWPLLFKNVTRRIKLEELFQVKGDQRDMTSVIYDPGPEKIFSIKALFEQL